MAETTPKVRHLRWDDLEQERLNPRMTRRMISGERAMIAHVYLDRGAVVPMHSHENEQLTYVISGALRFWIPHKAVALEDTLDVDIFTPPRQDWIDGTDAYLRAGGD